MAPNITIPGVVSFGWGKGEPEPEPEPTPSRKLQSEPFDPPAILIPGRTPIDASILANTRGYYYNKYPSTWDVERARRATQLSGYGQALIRIPVNAAVGPAGFEIRFKNGTHQRMWDTWQWNRRWPWKKFDEALRQAARSLIRDGETIAELEYGDGRIYLNQHDMLDIPLIPGRGVHLNDHGVPVEYEIRPWQGYDPRVAPVYPHNVSAENIIHVFHEEYERQIRGISWLRPSLDRLGELEDLLVSGYATVRRNLNTGGIVRLSANWNVEPRRDPTTGDYFNRDGTVMTEQEREDYAQSRLDEALTVAPDKLATVQAEKDEIEYLELAAGNPLPEKYKDLVGIYLASIARSVGMSYFSLTGDVSSANYSSLRFGLGADRVATARIQRLLTGWTTSIIDKWGTFNSLLIPNWPRGWTDFDIIFPRPPDIDPVRDAQARKIDLESEFMSRQEMIREDGRDPDIVAAEIVKWREMTGAGKAGEPNRSGQSVSRN